MVTHSSEFTPSVIDFFNRMFDDHLGGAVRECAALIIDSHGHHMSAPLMVLAIPVVNSSGADLEFSSAGVFTVLRSAQALYIGIYSKAAAQALYIGIYSKAGKHLYRQSLADIGQQPGLLSAGSKIAWITNSDELKAAVRSACAEADEAFR